MDAEYGQQECQDCRAGLDHCHGTLIVHQASILECTDQHCSGLDMVRHEWVVDCRLVDGDCDCIDDAVEPAPLLRTA